MGPLRERRERELARMRSRQALGMAGGRSGLVEQVRPPVPTPLVVPVTAGAVQAVHLAGSSLPAETSDSGATRNVSWTATKGTGPVGFDNLVEYIADSGNDRTALPVPAGVYLVTFTAEWLFDDDIGGAVSFHIVDPDTAAETRVWPWTTAQWTSTIGHTFEAHAQGLYLDGASLLRVKFTFPTIPDFTALSPISLSLVNLGGG